MFLFKMKCEWFICNACRKSVSFETPVQGFDPVLGGSGRAPVDLSTGRMTLSLVVYLHCVHMYVGLFRHGRNSFSVNSGCLI